MELGRVRYRLALAAAAAVMAFGMPLESRAAGTETFKECPTFADARYLSELYFGFTEDDLPQGYEYSYRVIEGKVMEILCRNEEGKEICIRIGNKINDGEDLGAALGDYEEVSIEAKTKESNTYRFYSFDDSDCSYAISSNTGLSAKEVNALCTVLSSEYREKEEAEKNYSLFHVDVNDMVSDQTVNTLERYLPDKDTYNLLKSANGTKETAIYYWKTDGSLGKATVKAEIYCCGVKKEEAEYPIRLQKNGMEEKGSISLGLRGEQYEINTVVNGEVISNTDDFANYRSLIGEEMVYYPNEQNVSEEASSETGEFIYVEDYSVEKFVGCETEELSIEKGKPIALAAFCIESAYYLEAFEDELDYTLDEIVADPKKTLEDHEYGVIVTVEFD